MRAASILAFILTFVPAVALAQAKPPVAPASVPAPGSPWADAIVDLAHPRPNQRTAALRALADATAAEAAVPVATLLADPVEQVQLEAINTELALFLTTRIRPRTRVGFIIEVRGAGIAEQAFDAGPAGVRPLVVPPAVIDGLITATDSPSERARVEATWALGTLARGAALGDPQARQRVIDALGGRLGYQAVSQRIASAAALARIYADCGAACRAPGTDKVGDALVGALNDPSPEVQLAATGAIGALRYERALQALTDRYAYFGPTPDGRASLDALARIAHPSSAPVFRTAIGEKDAGIRRFGVDGIARIGAADGVAAAERSVGTDREDQVRLAVAFAQEKAARANRMADLVASLGDNRLRAQASDYLAELGRAAAGSLAPHLAHASPVVRLEVARLLALVGGAADLAALERARSDSDRAVAAAADIAVGWIKAGTR